LHSHVGSCRHMVRALQVVVDPRAVPVARRSLTQAVTGSSGRPGCPWGYYSTPCFCSVTICANDHLTTPLTNLEDIRSTLGQALAQNPYIPFDP
jgi:hypothetical protein